VLFCVGRDHFYLTRVDGAFEIGLVLWETMFESSRPGAAAEHARPEGANAGSSAGRLVHKAVRHPADPASHAALPNFADKVFFWFFVPVTAAISRPIAAH
jgi:hypothetical protein